MIALAVIIPALIGIIFWNERNKKFDKKAEHLTKKLNSYLEGKKCQ